MQPAMADVGHQRQSRQFFHGHTGLTGIHHCQTQARRCAGLFTACGDQQPVRRIAGGNEILGATQAQIRQPRLHVGRTQAALFGRTQRAEAQRCARPQHAQCRLITDQKRQPWRRHPPPARHRQFERRDVAQLLQQRRKTLGQVSNGGQSFTALQQIWPGHKRLLVGCHISITKGSWR